jgi:hypothetical protein
MPTDANVAYEDVFKSFTGGGWNELKRRYGGEGEGEVVKVEDEEGVEVEQQELGDIQGVEEQVIGGAKRKTTTSSGNVKIVEVDVFKIYQSSVGKTGGRYMAQSPYIAAGRAANRLFSNTSGNSLNFVLQKTTRGSNNKYYAYTATRTLLKKPLYVFKKDEKGNRIYMPVEGKPIRVNSSGTILNLVGSKKMTYNPKVGMRESYNVEPFDWEKYLIKKVQQKVKVEAVDLPASLKNKYEDEVQAKKEKSKDEKTKARMKTKKLLEKAKAVEKKALMAERKAAKMIKEQEKKQRAAEKKAAKKAAAKTAPKKPAKKTSKKGKGSKKMMFGGCGIGSCTL